MALVSPGVQVTVTDESQYLPAAIGSVPFVVVATQENKVVNGSVAPGTLKTNAGKIYGISSQRELVSTFGSPVFRRSVTNTPMHGDELNEYGLMAAYSALGLGNRVWVVRADVDLDDLVGTTVRPKGQVADAKTWFDISASAYGIYEFNDQGASSVSPFTNKLPHIITTQDDTELTSPYRPLPRFGSSGDYAVNTLTKDNLVYYKTRDNNWVVVGSDHWASNIATVVSAKTGTQVMINSTGNIEVGSVFTINGNTIPVTGAAITSMTSLASTLNAVMEPMGVMVKASPEDRLEFYVTAAASFNGNLDVPTANLVLADGDKSPLSRIGFFGPEPSLPNDLTFAHTGNISSAAYGRVSWSWDVTEQKWRGHANFNRPAVQHSGYADIPAWRDFVYPNARPNGSVWMKTSAEGAGTNLVYKKYSAASNSWNQQAVKVFKDAYDALYSLDRLGGGINIAAGSLFAMHNPLNDSHVGFKFYMLSTNGITKVTGSKTTFTLTNFDRFTLKASQITGVESSHIIEIKDHSSISLTDPQRHQKKMVQAIIDKNIPNVSAVVEPTGAVSIIHRSGGIISITALTNSASSAASTVIADSGFDNAVGVLSYIGGNKGTYHLTNWRPATDFEVSRTTPTAEPADGSLWYYDDIVIDVMVNDATGWKGYRNVIADARGYNLTLTDENGVIVSASEPIVQKNGTTQLQSGDLWLDTSDLENFPRLYRYDAITRIWNLINNTDRVSQNGIVFADARWDTDGKTNTVSGALPTIKSLLTSDYIDLDAPDSGLYPRGTLLFNTRRSGYIVKKYVKNYFNATAYPNATALPDIKSTWVSQIGYKANGQPMMGHFAQRNEVVTALRAAIDGNPDLREEGYNFNILAAPGYPELITNLVALNTDRGSTGFVIGDTTMTLPSTTTDIVAYDNTQITTASPYLAVYYPSALTSDLSGNEIAVPASHMMLRTFLYNDQVAYQWFAPAGTRRGLVDNATAIGYVDNNSGNFVRTGISNQLRDTLYDHRINPITLLNGVGIVAYGQKTRNSAIAGAGSAMDRVNVSRLVNYLRTVFQGVANQFIMEPNDKVTRDQIKTLIESLLNDLIAKRGLYDYIVVCDESNNTSDRIARNELYVDIAVEPMKAVEFIYIPIRLRNPGTISGSAITSETE